MGAIRKRKGKGGYEARWYGPDGRQHTKTFPRRDDAKNHIRKMEGDKLAGTYVDPRLARTPFREVADEWLATNPGRKENTRHGYKGLLNNHVLPALGDTPVGKITRARIRQFVAEMTDAGAAPGTVRNTFRNVLKPVLDIAVENRYIIVNPAVGVRLPASARTEMLFLTAEQVAVLAEAMPDPYGVLIYFAAYTGLRAGEIGALRMKNLDLMRARVTVAESVAAVPGRGLVYGPTKTYAIRTVSLPRFLVNPLAAYVAPRAGSPDALVFVTPGGRPMRHTNFMADHFRPTVARLVERGKERHPTGPALPEHLATLRFHDLRHTAAALMVNPPINANPKVVQERLGHSSIQVTFDRYGHLFPGLDEDISVALDAVHNAASGGASELLG